jgi:phosphoglycolate phosphatase-like HAD superfamily hydrolase
MPTQIMKRSKTIALDCDGVLLDYAVAYGQAWASAFGEQPTLTNPHAYWPMDRWGVPRLAGEKLEQFRKAFNDDFWSTIPAIEGALEACDSLVSAGFELICVTALSEHNLSARKRNLNSLGFPIVDVIATDSTMVHQSPKADALHALQPVAFVDDFAPYLVGVGKDIHKALVLREADGSPNVGDALKLADSTHMNLAEFAELWCNGKL